MKIQIKFKFPYSNLDPSDIHTKLESVSVPPSQIGLITKQLIVMEYETEIDSSKHGIEYELEKHIELLTNIHHAIISVRKVAPFKRSIAVLFDNAVVFKSDN